MYFEGQKSKLPFPVVGENQSHCVRHKNLANLQNSSKILFNRWLNQQCKIFSEGNIFQLLSLWYASYACVSNQPIGFSNVFLTTFINWLENRDKCLDILVDICISCSFTAFISLYNESLVASVYWSCTAYFKVLFESSALH